MKKHLIGFTVFAFIVGSFISVWALFGYFTQTIPNVPKVESDNVPVFESDKKTSCFKQYRGNTSYEIVDSYYFADEQKVVTTVKVRWNGLGTPPSKVMLSPRYYIGGKEMSNFSSAESRGVTFGDLVHEIYMSVSSDIRFDKHDLKENVFVGLDLSTGADYQVNRYKMPELRPVVAVHGDNSVIR